MSLFFGRPERRAISSADVWGSHGSAGDGIGGLGVVPGGLQLSAVYAATSLIADLVSTSPLRAYRRGPDGTLSELPAQPALVTNPGPYSQRLIDWLHQALSSLLLRGNAFGYITALGTNGWPSQVQWLHPDAVTVVEEQEDWFHRPSYWWRGHPLDRDLVVHVAAYTLPGSSLGLSPLALFKRQIETGLKAAKFGGDYFDAGGQPVGHLKNTAKKLVGDEPRVAKDRFKAALEDRDVFVTGSDWDYSTMSVKAEESQFLETIQATATQIAAIYRVAPEDIGGKAGTSLTYKTLEQDSAKLTTRTLSVWAERMSEALTSLLPRPQFAAFDLEHLARGDRSAQVMSNAAALASGEDTIDEVRRRANKPPLTPEQLAFWQENYRGVKPPTAAPAAADGGQTS